MVHCVYMQYCVIRNCALVRPE